MKSEFINLVSDFIFPKFCALCQQDRVYLCNDCIQSFESVESRCIKCSRKNPLGLICPSCVSKYEPNSAHALFKFTGSVRQLIHQLKYEDLTSLALPFANELAQLILRNTRYEDFKIVPIPIGAARKRFRGYNQSRILAQEVSNILGIELTEVLARVEVKNSQVRTHSREERLSAIRGAFAVQTKPHKKLILIDDVITTGATVREATKQLKRAGAEEVIVFAIAM